MDLVKRVCLRLPMHLQTFFTLYMVQVTVLALTLMSVLTKFIAAI